jgi:hypothetical protein
LIQEHVVDLQIFRSLTQELQKAGDLEQLELIYNPTGEDNG